ncbi:MAG TPA: hypothetical protein VFZ17_12450 [Acidimicrobiia bacterium]|nr:hypothetical protein [Acidimicrobiia bacterium]
MTDAGVPIESRGERYLGWRAEHRPRPGFAHVLGAAAGGFAVVAMVAFVSAIDNDDPQVPGIALSLVLLLAAWAIGVRGPGPLRSASVTAMVVTVPILWVFALVSDGDSSRSDVRAVLLLTLFSYAALYLLGWTRGRAILLGGALLVLTIWVAFEVAGDNAGLFGVTSGSPITNGSLSSGAAVTDNADSTRAAIMLLGIAFLIAGAIIDNRRLAGTATPFLLVGSISAIVGGVSLAASESTLAAGIVAVLIGSAIGIIGAAGRDRRGTTWLGVLTVFGGGVAILVDISPDEAEGVGAIALVFAVVLGALAWLLAPIFGEPDDGNDFTPSPTAPDGGTSARDTGDPGDPDLLQADAAA